MEMDPGLATLLGMSVAYLASFVGLTFAYLGWRRQQREREQLEEDQG
jgi:hypothetical protein